VTDAVDIALLGVPMQAGAGRPGCLMGPDALRTAGLAAEPIEGSTERLGLSRRGLQLKLRELGLRD